ncbi:DUF993 family protein, partial [Amycolatopsis mediterranei]
MLVLPAPGGELLNWSPSGPRPPAPPKTPQTPQPPPTSRIAYAAAHVVADALADEPNAVDWDTTLAFREHLWSCGLGVAEAMDTAQRGMGLDWATTQELVSRTGAVAAGRRWCAGVGTDQLPPGPATVASIVDAWREQLELVSRAGAVPVVMAS